MWHIVYTPLELINCFKTEANFKLNTMESHAIDMGQLLIIICLWVPPIPIGDPSKRYIRQQQYPFHHQFWNCLCEDNNQENKKLKTNRKQSLTKSWNLRSEEWRCQSLLSSHFWPQLLWPHRTQNLRLIQTQPLWRTLWSRITPHTMGSMGSTRAWGGGPTARSRPSTLSFQPRSSWRIKSKMC